MKRKKTKLTREQRLLKKSAKHLGYRFDPKALDRATCDFLARAGVTLMLCNMPEKYRILALEKVLGFAFRWWRLERS